MKTEDDLKLQDLIQAVNDTCPLIEAEAEKLHNGRGDDNSLPYIEQLVADLAEALSKCTGNALVGYDEGYEEGLIEGRDEGEEYDRGYDDGYADGKQAGLDEADDDES